MLSHIESRCWQWALRAAVISTLTLAGCQLCLAQATAEYGVTASSVAGKIGALAKASKWTINPPEASKPGATNAGKASSYLVVPSGPSPALVNRRALEEKAGKDAAKLLLRSEPSGGRIWVNGIFVGTTPVLLIVPPGRYHIKISDDRLDDSEQDVGLLPHETRKVVLRLAIRYPARVSIR
jgi:hypothetical protein